ncbi:MAG: NADH-quinone oxidoreductase subunit C [Frankiaceae bacterium]|nr:NADH-quinone oxidoreductase subunit C [Frankiaceae bacterium]
MSQRTRTTVTAADLADRTVALLADSHRLALTAAHQDADGFRVVYLFTAGHPDRRVELELHTDSHTPEIPTLAAVSFPAGRFEREMRDLYGIVPLHHPLPRRLVRHQHWPRGWYPMRSDAGPRPAFEPVDDSYGFLTVQGRGVYEIPVGPIHAGVIEPGHFRFSVVGETIIKLKARLWFTHKGIEKLAEGKSPSDALPLMERVSGDTAVGHSLAFCLAVEEALGWSVPEPASLLRAVVLELERLYNHIADIGALCNDVGFGVLNAHALRIREQLLRLNADVTGHRLLRGAVLVGGATVRQLPTAAQLAAVAAEVAEIVDLALRNSTVRDRFTGTALLSAEQVRDVGALGYVARASGVDHDARRDHPFHNATTSVSAVTDVRGDVLARFLVRAGEVQASVALLNLLLAEARSGAWLSEGPQQLMGERMSGVGLVEGWRGTVAHRVEVGADGRLARVKIVDPSFMNWPALPLALGDTIVPDFPLVNKSFNLSYAGNDL